MCSEWSTKWSRAGWRLGGAFLTVLALAVFAVPAVAQEVVISGRVTSELDQPLADAQVSLPAYNLGTLSGPDGNYTLTVPAARLREGAVTIQARLIGYRSQEAEVALAPGARLTQNFQLAVDPVRLEDIVATGQGLATERRRLGSAVSTIRAEEVIGSQETNIVAALAGKAANVEVTSSTGDPGGGAYVRIRGANTLSGSNQPLFVVDGTPISNSSGEIELDVWGTAVQNRAADINPEDIASVEILKGPSASAIYGAAGANGAVLITTKSGQRNAPTQFTLKATTGVDDVTQLVPLQRSFGRGLDGAPVGEPGVNVGPTQPVSWGPQLACAPNCVLGQDVFDHHSELYETAMRYEGDMTLAGGGDRTTYFLSGGYSHFSGTLKGNSELDKATVRLKASQDFLANLTVSGNFAYAKQRGDLIQQGSNTSGILLGGLRTPPEFNNLPYIDPETGLHRSYRCNTVSCDFGAFNSVNTTRGFDNPFWVANELPNTTDVDRTFGNLRADYDPFSWLNVAYTLGADYYTDARLTVIPKSSSDFPSGRLIRADLSEFNVDHSLLATATHRFGDDLTGSVTVGQNLRHEEFRRFQVDGQNLIFGTEQLDFAVNRTPDEFKSEVRTEGYFATADLALYDQLFLAGGVRLDASSTFGGEEVRRFLYPKGSLAWEFTQQPAFQEIGFLDYGKLRGAFGIAGKAPPVFSNVSGFETAIISDGWVALGLETIYAGNEGVIREAVSGNQNIDPERTWEAEGGLDLAFLDSRVSVSGTYYYQKTTDAILDLPVAPSTGFFERPVNGAEYLNKGWELTLDLMPIRRDDFRWEISGQWAKNDSEVLDLLGGEEFGIAGFTGSAVSVVRDVCGPTADQACEFGVFFGEDVVRFGRGSVVSGVDIDQAFSGWEPGDIYIAADGLPIADPQSRWLGDPNPDWTASVRNSFTVLDRVRISGLIDISEGAQMWNGTKGALFHYGTHAFSEPVHGAGVQHTFGCESGIPAGNGPALGQYSTCASPSGVAGPGAGQPATLNWLTWGTSKGSGFGTGTTWQYIEDASFVKLRDISLSVTLDQPWVSKVGGASRIELTASGRNLKTWTDYTGIDPESSLVGQDTGRGLEYFNNPQTRSVVFTVSIVR